MCVCVWLEERGGGGTNVVPLLAGLYQTTHQECMVNLSPWLIYHHGYPITMVTLSPWLPYHHGYCITLKKSWKLILSAFGPYSSSSCLKKNHAVMPTSNSSVFFLWSLTRSSRAWLLSRPRKSARDSRWSHGIPRVLCAVSVVRTTLCVCVCGCVHVHMCA